MKRIWTAIALLTALSGCTSARPNGSGSPALATDAPSPLECETLGFPCSFAELTEEVQVQTESLASAIADRLARGEATDEVASWLLGEDGVAEVDADTFGVRFRPDGGRPVWVTLRGEPAVSLVVPRGSIAFAGSWDVDLSGSGPNAHVVAPGSRTRQARVLSPYQWDFGDSDDGAAVAGQLESMPDYAGNVVHIANATSSATDVSVDDFQGWQGLDVVHVVSHGFRVCAQGTCRAAIAAHSVPNGLADLIANRTRGLDLEVSVGPDDSLRPRHHVLLGADFFRAEYPRGLDDAVVFLNGCATFGQGATDLADAIRGQTSVVLGWDQTVATTAAHDAGLAVFNELGGNGRTVGDALEELGPLSTSLTTDRAGRPITSNLSSSGRKAGGDLRIRDIVQLSNAAGTGPLTDGSEVAIVGVAQDGLADSVAWQVLIDGIEPAAAAALVRVTIDGHAAMPVAVSTGSMQAPNSWLISGTVQLGSDFVEEHEAPFEAVLELPEGGLSTTTVTAIIVGQTASATPAPAMGSLWRGHLTYSFEVKPGVMIEAEADVDFAFDGGSERILIYPAVSGRMSYAVHGTTPDGCTSTLAPVEVAISPDNVSGGLRIDVSTSPPIFEGTVSVTGPEVEVMQTCVGEYAYLTGPYTTVARAVFIQVFFSDGRTVEGDAIHGTNNTAIDSRTFDISRVD